MCGFCCNGSFCFAAYFKIKGNQESEQHKMLGSKVLSRKKQMWDKYNESY